ncbi:MAG: MFS transporter [Desulfobacterales bacterium]|nr:MFS transporter [Desulfobacterales bacterium]
MPKAASKYLIPQFMLAHFSYHVCTGVLIPLLPLMRESLGLNYFQSGLLVSCYTISYGLAQLPMAMLADRFSSRLIIIWGMICISLTGIGVSFTQSYGQMVPFFVAMGVISASYHAPATSFISQVFLAQKRGRALGFHNTGGSASFLLTPAMALGVAYLFSTWRAPFFILALPALLVGVILLLTTTEIKGDIEAPDTKPERSETGSRSNESTGKGAQQISWSQIIVSLGIVAFLSVTIQLFSAGVRSYLPLYMVDRHGISPQLAGLVISLIAGSGIIGAPLGGALSDRFGRKKVILFSLSLSGPLLLAVTRAPYGIPLLVLLLLYGMTMSVRMPSMLSLIADVVPVGRRTTVLGIYYLIGEEIAGITTPLIGHLIDIYGINLTFTGVAVGLCIIPTIALIFRKYI